MTIFLCLSFFYFYTRRVSHLSLSFVDHIDSKYTIINQ